MTQITVGIPTYNSSATISLTLETLLNQIESKWKCVISDDNSTDNTVSLIEEITKGDSRFEIVIQPKRLGPAENWNYLLNKTNTKYFKLLHADDLLHPLNLHIAIKTLELNPDCVLLSSNRKYSSKPNTNWKSKISHKYSKLVINQVSSRYLMKGYNFIGEPSFVIYDTKALQKAGGFSNTWNYLIDLDSYFKVLNFGSFIKLAANLGIFRISKNSWSSQLLNNQLKEEYRFLIHTSNRKKRVIFGLVSITIRSLLRQIYFRIFARLK